jgi:competence protein ComGC
MEEQEELPLGAEPREYEEARGSSSWWILGVLLVGAALAMVLTPNFLKARARGQLTACKSNCKNLATALEMWASDHKGRYPASLDMLLDKNYLKAIPTCPGAGADTYSITYECSIKPDNFSFYCSGDNHKTAYGAFTDPSKDFPKYTAVEGLIDHPAR